MKKILLISAALSLAVAVKAQETLTLYPDVDAIIVSHAKPGSISETTNYGTYSQLRSWQWTVSGYVHKIKSLIDFDLSGVPANSIITNATLYLYGTGSHDTNITRGSSTYKSNASYLRRILEPWDESTVTWSNAPSVSTSNQATIPNSSTTDQDYAVDVTSLIRDMITYPGNSHGLMMQLVTESHYTEMQFASSDYTTDTTMRPKLVIEYKETRNYQIGKGTLNSATEYNSSNPFQTAALGGKKQYLVKASELTAAGMVAGDIYSLAFNVLAPQTDMDDLNIKIGHTSASTLGSTFLTGLTSVFSDSYVPYTGWNDFTFSSPFTWNGTSNVLVEICFENYFYGTSSNIQFTNTGYNSVCGDDDGCSDTGGSVNQIRPNLKLKADKGIIPYHAFTEITSYTSSPSSSKNYVRSASALAASGSSATSIMGSSLDPREVNESIEYFDGLGRPIQSVAVCTSPTGKDLVKPTTYDENGRVVFDFLPYPASNISSSNGGFRDEDWESSASSANDQLDYYQDYYAMSTGNPYAYSKIIYEASPLNRVLAQGAPGASWQPSGTDELSGHTTRYDYSSNTSSENDDVRLWSISASTVSSTGFYNDDELYKTIVYNEDYDESTNDDAYTIEYRDKLGRVVLREAFLSGVSDPLRTYYIYDDFGLLRYVFPPEFSDTFAGSSTNQSFTPTTTEIKDYCYYYAYDGRKRMIEKQLPGAEAVYMIYDQRDRLVLTQDGKLREDEGATYYLFTLYDYLNRPVVNGQCNLSGNTLTQTRTAIKNDVSYAVEADNSVDGYDLTDGLPAGFSYTEYYTYSYYDSYDFRSNVTGCSTLTFDTSQEIADYTDQDGVSNGYFDRVKGQLTGTRVKVLDGVSTSWVNTVIYYDDRYRPIQTHQAMYPYGTSVISTKYGFTGNMLATRENQSTGSNSTEVNTTFSYDHANRLLETHMSVDQSDPILLAQNVYNEHGELIEKNLHSDDDQTLTQSVDYQYNIRGWLSSINDPEELTLNWDLFGLNLFYDDPGDLPGASSLYSGNISAIQWAENDASETGAYSFTYDDLNRIEKSNYNTKQDNTWTGTDNFDTEYQYDLNGNLLFLQRNNDNGESIDRLFYEYNGNRLASVDDGSDLSENAWEREMVSPFAEGSYTIKTQYLLKKVELDAAGLTAGCYINSIAFFAKDFDNSTVDILVKMGPAQGTLPVISTTTVYDGSFTVSADGWNEITFSGGDEYYWNGLYDIAVEINKENGTGISENVVCEVTSYNSTYSTQYSSAVYYTKRPFMMLSTTTGLSVTQPKVLDGDLNFGFTDGASLASEYLYDDNGNMISDLNKDLEVEYNYLNLPQKVSTADINNDDEISYIYDATGSKLVKIVSSGSSLNQKTLYAGGFVYTDNDGDTYDDYSLDYILNAEGKIDMDGTTVDGYHYFLKDHLGNTRVVFNESGIVLQESGYYPFGLPFNSSLGGDNRYLFNGKELQDEQLGGVNLDHYDYGLRFYDPALARFTTQDPLADERYWVSPYNYVQNNPINRVDPTGAIDDWYTDEDNNVVHVPDAQGEIKGTNLKWLAPESATVAGSSTIVANSAGETLARGTQENVESSMYGVADNPKYNEVRQAVYDGQDAFLNDPRIKAAVNGLTFVATGGIEGLYSLTTSGIKGVKLLGQQGTKLLNFADDVSIRSYTSINTTANTVKNEAIESVSQIVWKNSSMSTKKWMIRNNITTNVKNVYNTNYEFFGPNAFQQYHKATENIDNIIRLVD